MAFFSNRTHEDFSAEVQAHLDLETDRLIAEGMSAEAARAEAHRAFGSVAIVKERFYETSRWMPLDQLLQDLRYAWRGIRHSPAFVATTVGTLAMALSLVTIAFVIVNAYVLRPFAVRDPQGLYQLVWHSRDSGGQGYRWSDYEEVSRRADLFSAVIGEHTRRVSSNGRSLETAVVSPNYFETLAPKMQLGRPFVAADAGGTGNPAVLTHQAWTRLYGADPSALGRDIDLNGHAFTIMGVLGAEFTGLGDFPRDLFVPIAPMWDPRRGAPDAPRETEILMRLQPGVSVVQAESGVTMMLEGIVGKQQELRAEVRHQPSPNTLSIEVIALLAPVFAAFGLVLATACANVSNVMLARAIARHREIAVRLSIGASRGRIVCQLLTEGFLIASLAGVAGLALASWGLRLAVFALFRTLPPSVVPILRLVPLTFDYRVFLFAFAASAAATLLFALLPALQASRISLTDALRGHDGSVRGGSRLRSALVVAQVAVALALVITAVTLARNGRAMGAMDLGFDPAGVTSINARGQNDQLARALADALRIDPRVGAVAVTSGNPLFNQGIRVAAAPDVDRGLRAPASIAAKPTPVTFVSPEYFEILRMPIARGRNFRADEARAAAQAAIVSAATASALWPGQDPIGRTLRIERPEGRPVEELPGYTAVTVVGTVGDTSSGLMVMGRDPGHIYLPVTSADPHANAILLRGRISAELGADALQDLFRRVAPDPQIFEVLPLREMRDLQTYPVLAASWVGSLLGLVALGLSASGLYGVLTYMISQRRKEIGIRMALGATAGAVIRLVVAQSTRLAGLGAAIGVTSTFAVLTLLNATIQLQAISLLDARAFAAGLIVVFAATAFAAYQPARRATCVDPSEMLRSDG